MLHKLWAGILNAISRAYYWFYHEALQMSEPFTRIFCRQEQNSPALFWGFWGFFALWCGIVLNEPSWSWWKLPALAYLIFLWWFIPHIVRYRVEHSDNLPFAYERLSLWGRLEVWAADRIGA